MGQKVNPHGLRVGVIKDWDAKWYAEDDFADIDDLDEELDTSLSLDEENITDKPIQILVRPVKVIKIKPQEVSIKFDKTKRVLIKDDGTQIGLTKKELAFLTILAQRMDTLVLHEEIKQNVWTDERVSDAAIRTFVKRIRDKVGVNLIKNISGLGYKISSKDDEI